MVFVSRSVRGDRDIYQMDAAYGTPTPLTTSEQEDTYPAWSPDASRIAFASGGRLTVMDVASRTIIMQLPDPAAMDSRPDWSPDGNRIVFTSAGHLYVVQADGKGLNPIVNAPSGVSYPAWSSNTEDIIFDTCNQGDGRIYRIHADGSSLESLISNSGVQYCYPSWSPDGSSIAFTSTINGQRDIYVTNLTTGTLTRLTTTAEDEAAPTWSPGTATYIVFVRARLGADCGTGANCAIYIINITSHDEIARTDTTETAYAAMPDWGEAR
jgi:TolB protein